MARPKRALSTRAPDDPPARRTTRSQGAPREASPARHSVPPSSTGRSSMEPALRSGLGLPPERQAVHAQTLTYERPPTVSWDKDDEAQVPRRARVEEPLTPGEYMERPVEVVADDLRASLTPVPPVRHAAREPRHDSTVLHLTNEGMGQALKEAERSKCAERRLYDSLPKLEDIPDSYRAVDVFLEALEEEAQLAGWKHSLYDLALARMSVPVRAHYKHLLRVRFPDRATTYADLVVVMIGSVAAEQPEQYLTRAMQEMNPPKRTAWVMYAHISRIQRAYLSLCQRLGVSPRVQERDFVFLYLKQLPENLGKYFIQTLPEQHMNSLYATVKYVSEIEARTAPGPFILASTSPADREVRSDQVPLVSEEHAAPFGENFGGSVPSGGPGARRAFSVAAPAARPGGPQVSRGWSPYAPGSSLDPRTGRPPRFTGDTWRSFRPPRPPAGASAPSYSRHCSNRIRSSTLRLCLCRHLRPLLLQRLLSNVRPRGFHVSPPVLSGIVC